MDGPWRGGEDIGDRFGDVVALVSGELGRGSDAVCAGGALC